MQEVYKKFNDDLKVDINKIFDEACYEVQLIVEKIKEFKDEAFLLCTYLLRQLIAC